MENTGGMSSVNQVAVVVRDIDAAMEHCTNDLEIGPWPTRSGPTRKTRPSRQGP